ncbi:cell surface A33 antigen-like [Simochromis diagramma]|uniref:cell surface A33 antigen-like n=1 Tax=Simochromis diagramma TaxID=43689 RepID=UPI001A7E1F2A|nr:cell surface A33 antigen-like [Simochromis diagramma]
MDLTSACCSVIFTCLLSAVCSNQEIITAESGQKNVTLTCRASNDNNILAVKWSRVDQKEGYVFLYQDGHVIPDYQDSSFKNRVDLQGRHKKDGDVSLILKDVTTADAGTYKCHVAQKSGEPMSLITTINLSVVVPPGQPGGHTEDGGKEDGGKEDGGKEAGGKKEEEKEAGGKEDGSVGLKVGLKVGLPVGVIVAAVVVVVGGVLIYRKLKPQSQGSYQPPAEQQPV